MIKLDGLLLERLPVEGLTWYRDLISFETPILSEYTHPKGGSFLYFWCDSDQAITRWMLARVSEATALRLRNGLIPLHHVLPKAVEDDFVYFVDCEEDAKVSVVRLIDCDAIPSAYKPKPGVFVDPQPDTEADSFVVVLDGNWEGEKLFEFEKNIRYCYSFMYSHLRHGIPDFGTLPFRGGFSGYHANNILLKEIPHKDRMWLTALHYSSPGFMRFDAVREIADSIAYLVKSVAENKTGETEYTLLSAYIKQNELRKLDSLESFAGINSDWIEHEGPIRSMTLDLGRQLRIVDAESFVELTNGVFQAAQLLRWFYRRIQDMAKQFKLKYVYFPPAIDQAKLLQEFNFPINTPMSGVGDDGKIFRSEDDSI